MTRVAPIAIVLGAAFGVLVTLQPISDSDLFWHVETGRRTIAGELPRADAFSWTIAGAPVLTDQWLGDAVLAAARAIGDWRGVLALRALLVALLVAVVVDGAIAARPRAPFVAALAALPAIALSRFAWTDRPELLGLVCFAVLVRLLRGGDGALLATIPLLFVWSQVHGSYALGLALVLAACLARAIDDRRERWRYLPIASAAIVATLLTPAGIAIWNSSGGHFLAPPRFVAEEGVPDARTLPGVFFLVTLALVVATAMLGSPARWRDAALLVPVAFVALTAARHTPFLAIAASAFFAEQWPDPLARWRVRSDSRRDVGATETLSSPRTPRLGRRGVPRGAGALGRAAVLAAGTLAVGVAIALAPSKIDESGYPRKALAALPAGPGTLNRYEWGGWLMYAAPATPVFIDGRLFPYVPAVLDDYRAIVNAHPGWERVADARGVRAILVSASDPIAVRAPERGWRVAYADELAVVLLR